ncbi:MAG: hypothetical protein M0P58_10395 [Bacteroidales bacterium]|nr:hypothetical protein [Bacteroidales bacterium]
MDTTGKIPSLSMESTSASPDKYLLRIGITGHRVLDDPALITNKLSMVFRLIKSRAEFLQKNQRQDWYPSDLMTSEGTSFHHETIRENKDDLAGNETECKHFGKDHPIEYLVISSLATGSDMIASRCALEILNAKLEVILPFCIEEYRKDFTEAELAEFNALLEISGHIPEFDFERYPPLSDKSAGYLLAGKKVVETSDILVAVWNGKPAKGTGGTAQVVAHTLESCHPVIWLHSINCDDPPKVMTRVSSKNDRESKVNIISFV